MNNEKWTILMKRADFNAVSKKFNISPIIARILRNRDLITDEEIEGFLTGSIKDLHDPLLMKDMDRAVDIIATKIGSGKRIRIIGDYDIDGVNSVYILMKGLKFCGAIVDYDIPDRLRDGYGINTSLIDRAVTEKIDTIITCDNGITAFEAVNYAAEKGLTVIVTDHHSLAYEEEDIVSQSEVTNCQIENLGCKSDRSIQNPECDSGRSLQNPECESDRSIQNPKGEPDRVLQNTECELTGTSGNGRIKIEPVSGDAWEGRSYYIPAADAVVNPHRPDCEYPYKDLCGAAVAWKLVEALYRFYGKPEEEWQEFIENAAFATVGDVVDLTGENRIIVKEGLKKLQTTENYGITALKEMCEIEGNITAYHLGFILGPCINAGGRLDTARDAIDLLLSEDRIIAWEKAAYLKGLNDSRKAMTVKGFDEAAKIIEAGGEPDKVIVIYLPNCHESLAGIIAGRLKEKYCRPSIVLTDADKPSDVRGGTENPSENSGNEASFAETRNSSGMDTDEAAFGEEKEYGKSENMPQYIKGSGRSIEGYSMFEELLKCSDILEKFGGHPMAAGLTLRKENLEALRSRLNDLADLQEEDMVPKVELDMELPFYYASEDLVREMELLEPYGKANRKPLFALRNVEILDVRIFGKNRNVARMSLRDANGHIMEGIRFMSGEEERFTAGEHMNIAYIPKINEFRGNVTVQAQIQNYKKQP